MINELLNPWMLVALAAMALPLLIEWLFRRRRQRLAFPAMRYLMNPRKRRRVQLQDLILLLVRTVVLGVLVVALARPLLRPEAGQGADHAPRHVAIVLDGSYSMGQAIGQTNAFAVAQTMAQDIIRGLPQGTVVSLVYLGQRPEVLLERTADRDGVHDAIGRTKVSDMAGRMADAVAAVDQLLAADGAAAEVYLLSDLQRSTWSATPEDPRDPQALLARLTQRHGTFVLDTGGTNPFNAYLTRFEPREKVSAVGMETHYEVDVEVRNMPANGKLWLTLYADEDKAATAVADTQRPGKLSTRELTAADLHGGRATLVLPHTFVEPGEHLLRVELEGDGLATDNQRYYLASVPANVEVLIVDPRHDPAPTADPLASGSGHLQNAIAPRTPPGFERLSPFAVTVRRPEEVLQLNLERFAVVVLTNLGNPSEGLVSRLEQYVGDGGNLLIFVGDAVTPYEYNTKLLKAGKGLLPCELEAATGLAPAEALSQAKATPAKSAELLHGLVYAASEPHPAVANVRQLTRQPAPPSVSRWMPFKLNGKTGEFGRPVVFLGNRQPLACERAFGQGKVMLVGTSADASWNYLVYTSEYLVLVQELLRWLVGEPDRAVNLQIGQAFQQPVLLSSQYLLLRRPDYSKVRLAPVPQGNLWRIAYDQADRQGIYEVDTTAEVMNRRRFVVNLVATEGDLTRLELEGFQRELAQAGVTYWGPDKAVRRAVEARHSIQEYAWLFLWAVLGLLAVETLLATRFGRRRI
ncbi:MAG: VWA domain-containing protein [Planctomycetia bacterium]|nr:VWA domain-containing protein [Planctomycetia bacterium]